MITISFYIIRQSYKYRFQVQMSEQDEKYDYDNQEDEQLDADQQNGQSISNDHLAKFQAHQSFDVSSFAESKTGVDLLPKHMRGFPISYAPTLQISPEPKLSFLPKNSKGENLKLQYESSRSKGSSIQQQLLNLQREIKQKDTQLDKYLSNIQQLNHQNLELEKIIREKDEIIKEKQVLLLQKERKSRQALQNYPKNSINYNSHKKPETSYADQFCPQFLSPDQSLQLFADLLHKIEKSTSIKKKICKDRKLMGIMAQILKGQ